MTSDRIESIGVVGGGAWGTALASVAARAGADTLIWAREREVCTAVNETHENTVFLPGVPLDKGIRATDNLTGLSACGALLLVTPAQALRTVLADLAPHISSETALVICSKGIERGTAKLMTQVLDEVLPGGNAMVLSGPSFAADVARGLPTAVTLAGRDAEHARPVAEALSIPAFRPYLSGDMIGAQVGGSVKNVLAIACGIVDGKGLGASARAALTTRGFAELSRFGTALGARPETLAGLSGLGDLILTCNSSQSRNMSLGMALGKGLSVAEVTGARNSVSEGVYSAKVVCEMADQMGVDMPICRSVHEIVEGTIDVESAIERLLNRPIKSET